ncbi:MAG: AAA family ATPase, partial [Bacteroidetes bacterium]|nr:AAA family ATPase [Bacteroidota bacterium]
NKLKLVFLNACATEGHVAALQAQGIAAIIATETSISDQKAKIFSEVFYHALANDKTLKEAFSDAKTAIEPHHPDDRVRMLKWGDKEEKLEKAFSWGLHILPGKEDVLEWRLSDNFAKERTYPHHLNKIPPPPDQFIGREEELQKVKELLNENDKLVLVNGLGGVGKTTLARKYVHLHQDEYDHILWVTVLANPDQDETASASEALTRDIDLFKSLKITFDPQTTEEEKRNQILSSLKALEGKNLMIIDNATHRLESLSYELPQPPSWQVLITSREDLDFVKTFSLDVLDKEEAIKLFLTHYPKAEREMAAVEELLEYIGYHTLTIELLAKTCSTSKLGRLTAKKILPKLKSSKLSDQLLQKPIKTEHNQRQKAVEIYSYLLEAFTLAGLSDSEKSLLLQFSVLPSLEIDTDIL